jgi:HD superfamily phosphohydrolase
MYWQVYLHKTVIAADQLLLSVLYRAKQLIRNGEDLFATPALRYFLQDFEPEKLQSESEKVLGHYVMLDDDDISIAIKMWMNHDDPALSLLAANMVNRRLFRIEIQNEPFANERIESIRLQTENLYRISNDQAEYFVQTGILSNHAYNSADAGESILVMQNGQPVDITVASDLENLFGMSKVVEKYFLCYPKELEI